jgi:hypothetical protein
LRTQWGSDWELEEHGKNILKNMTGTQCEELHGNRLRTMQIQYPYPPQQEKKRRPPGDMLPYFRLFLVLPGFFVIFGLG